MQDRKFLAIDLGGTKLAIAVFTEGGEIIHREQIALHEEGNRAVGSQICEIVKRFRNEVISAGIGVPGIVRGDGTVWAPNIRGWDEYALLAETREAAGTVPVAIDSDRACYILGEQWMGNAQDCDDAIYIAVGTGIGAGIISGGQVLRGAHDIAGAVGWMALDRPYLNKYNACGCFETQASGDGIAKVAKELLRSDPEYCGQLRSLDKLTAHEVFAALTERDKVAERTIAQCVELWGMAAANLVSIFNPEKVIFGGGVFGPAIPLLPAIREEAAKWAQPIAMRHVSFEPSALGSDAGLYGAGLLAKRNVG